jgi:hypothetical protein
MRLRKSSATRRHGGTRLRATRGRYPEQDLHKLEVSSLFVLYGTVCAIRIR